MSVIQNLWAELVSEFTSTFITEQRYLLFLNGLKTTLIVAFAAAALGIVLGFITAYIRSTYDQTGHLRILNALAKLYLTVIRGTPTMIQLLIMYFVIFGSVKIDKLPVAIMAFGINSGAYVAEIFRSGIMSIPPGQMELENHSAPGRQKRSARPGQRGHRSAEGDLHQRLYRIAGSDQGRRHRPQPHLQRLLPLYFGGCDLPGAGALPGEAAELYGREAGTQ